MMIDDDQDTLMLYELSIKETCYSSSFLTFDNAKKAIDYLESCMEQRSMAPDYIIIDLNMPDMDGFQFLSAFEEKFYPSMSDTKVITATSSIREKDREKAIRYSSVVAFVPKPLSKAQLLELFCN